VLLKDSQGRNSKSLVRYSYQRVLKVTLLSGETWMLDFVGAPEKGGRIIECWQSYMESTVSMEFPPTPMRDRLSTFSVYSERQIPLIDMWRWSVWPAFDMHFGKLSWSIELSTKVPLPELLKGSPEKFQHTLHDVVEIVTVLIAAALTKFYESKELSFDMPRMLLKNMFKQSGTKIGELERLYPHPNAWEKYILNILRGEE
jgi:hypothetical protein